MCYVLIYIYIYIWFDLILQNVSGKTPMGGIPMVVTRQGNDETSEGTEVSTDVTMADADIS